MNYINFLKSTQNQGKEQRLFCKFMSIDKKTGQTYNVHNAKARGCFFKTSARFALSRGGPTACVT